LERKPSPTSIVSVALPVALTNLYSYRVPEGAHLVPGSVVAVPLKTRKLNGVVWEKLAEGKQTLPSGKLLLEIETIYDCPILNHDLRRFSEWVARYYLVPLGMVLRMILNVPQAFKPIQSTKQQRLFQINHDPSKNTEPRKRLLQYLKENPFQDSSAKFYSRTELAVASGVSKSVIDKLIESGCLKETLIPIQPAEQQELSDNKPMLLNHHQKLATTLLQDSIANSTFKVFLLDGVTGSGKTEVCFQAIAHTNALGKQVLVLLPEVALTAQFIESFRVRFGIEPYEWHSRTSQKNRARCWRNISSGSASIVVGARSAIFLPFRNLGLIVVDEEHDGTFKQTDRVNYHARDMAIVRGKFSNATVVLASATPSIESLVNVRNNRYQHIILPIRAGGASLPNIEIVDIRGHGLSKKKYISPVIYEALRQAINEGAQGILFLNRRGYCPITICHKCGLRYQCCHCSTWLVEHREPKCLLCHYCGYSTEKPTFCHACKETDSLVSCGPGVERISEELSLLFPEARKLVLSSDMHGGMERLRTELTRISQGEVDIIIGTQLIAKGHNFPKVKIVGVIDADLGLSNGDLRAGERTFQVLQQVTGRAGRVKAISAKGFIQTRSPHHPLIQAIASGDTKSFYKYEINEREASGMPPFQRLASIIVACKIKEDALSYARHLAQKAPAVDNINVLGPIEAPLFLLRDRYRFRLLVKTSRKTTIQTYIQNWLSIAGKPGRAIDVKIDIDPYCFL